MTLEDIILEKFPLRIMQGTLDTAQSFARLATLDGQAVEAYMHLVGDDVIKDVVLTKEQYVGAAFCQPTVQGLADTYASLGDNQIVGWCHSHADFSNFFSSMDKNNVRTFTDMGGIVRDIEGEPISLFYNLVVNVRNDTPYSAISYFYQGNYGLIEHVPLIVLPGGTKLSEQAASEQLKSALRHPCAESVPPFEFTHLQPDMRMLEILVGDTPKITYKQHVHAERELYAKTPAQYSSSFESVLDALEGRSSRLWVDRVADIFVHYMRQAPTAHEKDAVKRLLDTNSYLKKNQHIKQFLDIILEASYAARSPAATLGNTETA
jgi:hypothetical protein